MTSAYRADNETKLVPCKGCGEFIDPKTALYSNQGDMVCRKCHTAAEIAETTTRANSVSGSTGARLAIVLVLVLLRLLLRFAFH